MSGCLQCEAQRGEMGGDSVLNISWDSESVSSLIQGTLRVGFLLL